MTYRIKKIKGESQGWLATPVDPKVSQWNAAREAHINAQHIEAKVYPPKVTAKNDIFPHSHEIYNCTTCAHGEQEHPANIVQNPEMFHIKCKPSCPIMGSIFNAKYSDGPRFEDINCRYWDRACDAERRIHGPKGIEL